MGLTLQFIPHNEIAHLGSARRVKKILDIVKEDKIVLLEGRLSTQEEKDLIEITMEEIGNKFKGIEIAVINPDLSGANFRKRIKNHFVNILLGDRTGLTIVGPASVVKEIKQNPDKIELLTEDRRRRRKK